MKKILCLALIALMLFAAVGCQQTTPPATEVIDTSPINTQEPADTQTSVQTATPDASATGDPSGSTATPVPTADIQVQIREDFNEYLEKNSDFIGWIEIPDTKIDNPVVQGTDDYYYVYHDFDKQESSAGTLFLGIDANIFYKSQNMVLHGHNMKDGTMFAGLHQYNSNANRNGNNALTYYQEHPLIYFDTLAGNGTYKIFATLYLDVAEPGYRDDDLFYYLYNDFADQEEFEAFLTEIERRSLIDTTVDVSSDDQILMLSVCDTNGAYGSYSLQGSSITRGHFIVVARKVRDGESTDVDTAGAKLAENPLMDQYWYTLNGGSAPTYEDRDLNAPWFIGE